MVSANNYSECTQAVEPNVIENIQISIQHTTEASDVCNHCRQ